MIYNIYIFSVDKCTFSIQICGYSDDSEIMKLVEKVKFITIKGFKGSLGARYLTKNVPSLPG